LRLATGAFLSAISNATSSGRKVHALNVNARATPTVPISAAASIGPQSLAMLNCTELSAAALPSSGRDFSVKWASDGPHISDTTH